MIKNLVDIGINLLHQSFSADREAVIRRACGAGVNTMILTGTSERASRTAADFAAGFSTARSGADNDLKVELHATAGVHPHDARSFTENTLQTLAALLARPEVAAVGECGLDFNRDFSPRPVQERVFEAQVELAIRTGKPLFLHERDAHERFLAIMRAHRSRIGRGVVHCFTGTTDQAAAYLDLGLFIGITGWICDERRGRHLLETVRRIPLDRLMLETDAPFLVPRSLPGRPGRNEPAFLTEVLKTVAQALDKDEEEVAAATTRNARGFFGLPQD
jgi:TatD DNase family protein